MRISEQIKIKSTKDGDLSIKSQTFLRPMALYYYAFG